MNGERILPDKIYFRSEYLLYLKQIYAYRWVKDIIPASSVCLDLGCGEGYGTKILSLWMKKIIGVDIGEQVIDKACRKYLSKTCAFRKYDGKTLPFPDNTFDAVVSFQVIEHVKDDSNFIAEAHRVLKKGGLFILATPNKNIRLPQNQKPWNVYHVREYSPHEAEKILKSRFSNVDILGINAVDEVRKIEQERIKQNLKIISWDFLNLRRILPKCISANIVKIVHFLKKREKDALQTEIDNLDISGLYKIEAQNVKNALDIVGVCRK